MSLVILCLAFSADSGFSFHLSPSPVERLTIGDIDKDAVSTVANTARSDVSQKGPLLITLGDKDSD